MIKVEKFNNFYFFCLALSVIFFVFFFIFVIFLSLCFCCSITSIIQFASLIFVFGFYNVSSLLVSPFHAYLPSSILHDLLSFTLG